MIIQKDMEFVHIPGGEFEMGDVFGDGRDDEKPVHKVQLDSFYLGKYPVTFDQYDAFCEVSGREKQNDEGWGRGRRPVIHVSWEDAVSFCDWLSNETGEKIRLSTEAEWEYAARECGKRMKWSGTNDDNDLGDYAWFDKNSDNKTHPVGEKKPNGFGLYDMSGNVSECCSDLFNSYYYKSSPSRNPQGPSSVEHRALEYRVRRGGFWICDPRGLRCSDRAADHQVYWLNPYGFRCARTL